MFGRPKNEIELLQASVKGSTEAFAAIVGRYQSLVCAITYGATGSVESSEELAQEAFLRAWRNLGQLRDLTKFRAWLCSIARSTVQNWFRSRKQDVVGKAAPLNAAMATAAEEAGPEEAAMTREQQAVVAHALAQIPEMLREPLILFYREQKSIREVAAQLELSENAARQRISRGRSMLRKQVAAMVETTIARTKPGKAFTTAVIAAVAATVVKTGTATAAAAGHATAPAAGSLGTATVVGSLGAKLAMIAAGVIVVAGVVVAWKQFRGPASTHGERTVAQSASQGDPSPGAPAGSASQSTPSSGATSEGAPVRAAATSVDSAGRAHVDGRAGIENPQGISSPAGASETEPFAFQPKGLLSGVVTDIETGAPVRGALVRIALSRFFDTQTDANGFYHFEQVHQPGNFTIAIDSKEYVGIPRGERNPVVHLTEGRQVVKHFQLPRACMVDLWVVDANGMGIKGADVVATSLADSRAQTVNYFGDLRKTDPNGYILLGGFPPAKTDYLIAVWHQVETRIDGVDGRRTVQRAYDCAPGKATVRLTDPNVIAQVQIVLERGEPVHGYAQYADGVPASDIQIVARPAWWHCNYSVQSYPINEDGTFVLKHVTPGTYDICACIIRPDFSGGTTRTVMQAQLPPADNEPLIVRLAEKSPQSLVAISGRFVFLGDKKPDNLHIGAYSPTAGHAHANVGYDPRGGTKDTFLLDRLEPGTYRLTFSGNGMEDTVLENVVAPSSDLVVELRCATKPTLNGTVVDARTGEPVEHFRVRARKLQTLRGANYVQRDLWTHFENARGYFSIEAVGPGVYQVQAAADGYAPAWSREINTDTADPVELPLTSGGAIAGRVIDGEGRPVAGAKVIPLSVAGGAMPRTKDMFVSEDGAAETVEGAFKLQNLPAGDETLKVTHPDYTFSIVEDVQVVEGKTTEGIDIVLTAGGTVEGYVYDEKGMPLANEVLHFQDDSGYSGSGDEQAGRFGTAIADSNGFYRLPRLPEKLCYVARMDEWKKLGVVRRVVVPRTGEVLRLDFGGTPVVSGAVIVDGVALAATRVLLGPVESPHFGTFKCYAVTDEHGGFAFAGATPGSHAIYYEQPQKQNQWLKVATVTVKDADIDLGVLPGNVAKLFITINAPGTDAGWTIERMYISQGTSIYATPLRIADVPLEKDKPWVMSNIEPGRYTLVMMLQDSVQWRREIQLEPGRSEWHLSLDIPGAGARLSGRMSGDGTQTAVLWREQKDILATILPSQDGTYSVENLPAGHYFVGDTLSLLYDLPAITELDLREDESKVFDLDLSAGPERRIALLTVRVVDASGMLRKDAHVRLEGPLGTVEPLQCTAAGHILISAPGEHVLHVEADGGKPATQNITLKASDSKAPQPQTIQVRLRAN